MDYSAETLVKLGVDRVAFDEIFIQRGFFLVVKCAAARAVHNFTYKIEDQFGFVTTSFGLMYITNLSTAHHSRLENLRKLVAYITNKT